MQREGSTPTTYSQEMVSLVGVKQLAQQMLPSSSALRIILLSQPDILPRSEALSKMEICSQLLYQEVGRK